MTIDILFRCFLFRLLSKWVTRGIMEPLSAAASLISVVTAVNSVGRRALKKIKSLRGAPDAVFALNNEVSEITLILEEVSIILRQNGDSIQTSICSNINTILALAKEKILEFEMLIEFQVMRVGPDNQPVVNRLEWTRCESKILRIQQDLHQIRRNLTEYLEILTSYEPSLPYSYF